MRRGMLRQSLRNASRGLVLRTSSRSAMRGPRSGPQALRAAHRAAVPRTDAREHPRPSGIQMRRRRLVPREVGGAEHLVRSRREHRPLPATTRDSGIRRPVPKRCAGACTICPACAARGTSSQHDEVAQPDAQREAQADPRRLHAHTAGTWWLQGRGRVATSTTSGLDGCVARTSTSWRNGMRHEHTAPIPGRRRTGQQGRSPTARSATGSEPTGPDREHRDGRAPRRGRRRSTTAGQGQ